MGKAQGLGDVGGRSRQDGESAGKLGDGAKVVNRLGLDQHADCADSNESVAVPREPVARDGIGANEEEGSRESNLEVPPFDLALRQPR